MNIEQIKDVMKKTIEDEILSELQEATRKQLRAIKSIDQRAVPFRLYFSDDVLVVEAGNPTRMLDYYGGFEYIKEETGERLSLGSYTVYSAENSRVSEILDELNSDKESDEA